MALDTANAINPGHPQVFFGPVIHPMITGKRLLEGNHPETNRTEPARDRTFVPATSHKSFPVSANFD